MAKTMGKRSIIGAVGGVLIGAAILLFTATMVLNSLKTSYRDHTGHGATWGTWNTTIRADWNATNASIDQLKTFMTVCVILLGILGIVLIGATIIGAISGGFGGSKFED
jgi:ABC-type antimicrobial peptide transport system permease subunit